MPRAATLMSKAHKRVGVTFKREKTFKKDDNSDGSSYKDGKSFNMDNSERRRLRSRAERAQSIHVNADRIQKKGTYGSKNLGRREMSRGEDVAAYSKVSSKRNQGKVTYDSKTETIRSGKPRTMWVTKYKEAAKSAKLPSKSTSKAKKSAGMDDVGNGLFKKRDSNKSDFKARSDKIQNVGTTVYSQKTAKNIVRDDKSSVGDSEEQEVKPKKRKRIRLDPYDISNKRLDDTIVDDEATIEKKGPEKRAEMSKNAQFRAIQPSASIISFVEDNLLGRRRLIELKRAGYNTELPAPLDNIPFSKSTERENIEETIFRNRLEFFAAAKVSSSFPPPEVSEIAFAGRSNVGKSSLLNALTRQWGVVRTSDKPGHTQSINFFKLGPKFSLVDLPGYGFAYAKEEVKDAWEELVKEYVSTRVNLKRVCLLVDTKWGMKPRDQELIDLMERYQTKYQIVLTKTDTVFPIDVARRAMQIEENLKGHKSAVQPVMMASSKSGAGVRCLRTVLAKVARFAKI